MYNDFQGLLPSTKQNNMHIKTRSFCCPRMNQRPKIDFNTPCSCIQCAYCFLSFCYEEHKVHDTEVYLAPGPQLKWPNAASTSYGPTVVLTPPLAE